MRKLVLILMGLIAVSTFIRAYNDPETQNRTGLLNSAIEVEGNR